MILHELVTNALKYGALTTPDGGVHLTWNETVEGGRKAVCPNWREENGPPINSPTRTGFGTRLIDFSARQSLGGAAELKIRGSGFTGACNRTAGLAAGGLHRKVRLAWIKPPNSNRRRRISDRHGTGADACARRLSSARSRS
jgi:hypothetical protein